jgi:hypothetical protein
MKRWPAAMVLAMLAVGGARADQASPARPTPRWIGSWGSSQMLADGENAIPADQASTVTLRQIVRLSAGGKSIRVRLSNAFGTRPLAIGLGHVARATAPGTPRIGGGMPLTFAGRAGAVISAGAEIYSDPIALPVTPGADLAVSLYLPDVPAPQTGLAHGRPVSCWQASMSRMRTCPVRAPPRAGTCWPMSRLPPRRMRARS